MIRMLPLVVRLQSTSHMAEARKGLEEADNDRSAQKVEKFAWNVLGSLNDTKHLLSILKQESRGVNDQRIQGLIRNIERHILAADNALKQIAIPK